MNINLKYLLGTLLLIISLIALNVYQWQNPAVVEVPAGTQQIDSTAWVQKSAYTKQGSIIDSLKRQNKALAKKVKTTGDEIANYTAITAKLNLQVDSLQAEREAWQNIPKHSLISEDSSGSRKQRLINLQYSSLADTVFATHRQFGDGLFLVTGKVQFRYNRFRQQLYLEQLRDIRLDVATTVNKDKSRVLTYVTSPDFASLQYKSFTTLKPKTNLPWFWIGLAGGVVGGAMLLK